MEKPPRRAIGFIKKTYCPKCGGELVEIQGGWQCENNDWGVYLPDIKVKWLEKAWLWLNNKKTFLGLCGMGLGKILSFWFPPIGEGVFYLSSGLTATGGIHKIVKGVNKAKNGKAKEWWEWALLILIEILKKFRKRR